MLAQRLPEPVEGVIVAEQVAHILGGEKAIKRGVDEGDAAEGSGGHGLGSTLQAHFDPIIVIGSADGRFRRAAVPGASAGGSDGWRHSRLPSALLPVR